MYYVTPACALASGVAAVLVEAGEVGDSPYLTNRRLRIELEWYVAAVGALVFVLLFCEFGLVRLTSSLSLAVIGVLKELITIVISSHARGDNITILNACGFAMCATGVLIYQGARVKSKSRERRANEGTSVCVRSRPRTPRTGSAKRGQGTPRGGRARFDPPVEGILAVNVNADAVADAPVAAGGAPVASVAGAAILAAGAVSLVETTRVGASSLSHPPPHDADDVADGDYDEDDLHSGDEADDDDDDEESSHASGPTVTLAGEPPSPPSSWSTSAIWGRLVGQRDADERDGLEHSDHPGVDSQEMGLLTRSPS